VHLKGDGHQGVDPIGPDGVRTATTYWPGEKKPSQFSNYRREFVPLPADAPQPVAMQIEYGAVCR
jgi:hypothetical protein